MKTETGIATDSAAAFRPANVPVAVGGMRAVSSGQPTAVAAPLPTPATRITAIVSGRSRIRSPPIAAIAMSDQPATSTALGPVRAATRPKPIAATAVTTRVAAANSSAVCWV